MSNDTSSSPSEQRRSYRIICYDDDGRVMDDRVEKNLTKDEAETMARLRARSIEASSSVAQPC